MKIIVAPNSFKGSLSATQAAKAIARGVREVVPDAEVVEIPIADGGEGTVEALVSAHRGTYEWLNVEGPLGDPVLASYGLIDGGNMFEVAFQVEDPGAFTAPWSAIQRFRRVHRAPMSELPCVESNAHYFNYDTFPVPVADKPDF